MRYEIRHTTRYQYTDPVTLCHNEARMTPLKEPGQEVHASRITVVPEPASQVERTDFFGNRIIYFEVSSPHNALEVTVTSEVTTGERGAQWLFASGSSWEEVRDRMRTDPDPDLRSQCQYLLPSPLVPQLPGVREYAGLSFPPGRPVLEAVSDLNHRIHTEFRYDPRATTVATPLSQVLRERAGVCQDFAHMAIACLRAMGLPAGYVSGYLETVPPPGRPKLRGVDASHAWFSVYLPGEGWFDLDPTNDKPPDQQYVVVARGRDYSDVPPLKGVMFGGGRSSLAVAVDVMELKPGQSPRPPKPSQPQPMQQAQHGPADWI